MKGLGQTSLSQTDHGNIAGSYKFFKRCNEVGIKPLLGMEAYYVVGDGAVRERDELNKAYYHLVLLAKNNNGLKNLMKLSSYAFTKNRYYKPRIDDALLAEYSEDIYATSSCLGSRASQLILNNEISAAERLLEHHSQIFKDRFFLEVQLHTGAEQQAVNNVLIELSSKRKWPLILTNDCHYLQENHKQLHELALKMATSGQSDGFSFGDIDVHVAHHDWMWKRAQALGIPYDAIINTKYLADSIQSETYFCDRKNRYTRFKFLPEGVQSWNHLSDLCQAALIKKFDGNVPSTYVERCISELKTIKQMGFSDYLLVVQDFVLGAKSINAWQGPGRGCFLPGMQVKLDTGVLKNIEDIMIGDRVVSHDGSVNMVYNTLTYDIQEEIVELQLDNGVTIQCTQDHEIYTSNRGWVAAINLNENDNIVEV